MLLLLAPVESIAASHAGLGADALRAESIRQFKEWRKSIPDYELRLYNRVKTNNKRLVRLTRINLFGFGILAIIMAGGFWWLSRRHPVF